MRVAHYKPFLRFLGGALIAVGVFQIAGGIDTVHALYNAAASPKVSLGFDLSPKYFLQIAAGVLVQFERARAASIVRWLAIFLASALASYLLLTSVYIPVGYLLAELWLAPSEFLDAAIIVAPVFLVLFAVIYLLGRPRMVAIYAARGVKIRTALIPMAGGALMAVPLVVSMATVIDGASARRARQLAYEQAGPNYGYFVERFGYHSETEWGPDSPHVTKTAKTATVMAYNLHEIRAIKVEWTEN